MKYGNHEFTPNGKLNTRRFKSLADLNLRAHTELKMWDDYLTRVYEEEPNVKYNHHEFYSAMGNVKDDLFLCDNGKVYIPCDHELMEFVGYRRSAKKMKTTRVCVTLEKTIRVCEYFDATEKQMEQIRNGENPFYDELIKQCTESLGEVEYDYAIVDEYDRTLVDWK